jgi:hypothetical protein
MTKPLLKPSCLALLCALSLLATPAVAQTNPARDGADAAAARLMATFERDAAEAANQGLQRAHQASGRAAAALLGTAQAEALNPDELDAAIAERVPGFAGFVHRDDGSLLLRLTAASGLVGPGAQSLRSSSSPAAGFARSLAAELGAEVAVAPALFNSIELLDVKRRSFALAAVDGVIGSWIDREANRVEVTYNEKLDTDAISKLTALIAAAGVPLQAVILRPGELMQPRVQVGASVRAQRPPLAAGSQIQFAVSGGAASCSVGVPALRGGVIGFVTASHCSSRTYSNGSSSMFAPTFNSNFVGTESVDPAGSNCNPQAALGCRVSDALFVSAPGSGTVAFGRVLLTNSSLTVTGSIPVRGTINQVSVGTLVYKTGRTTGLRSGRIARTCVDALVGDGQGGPNYVALCSTEINSSSFSAGGDSGSSIWAYDGTGALISGILSYGSSNRTGFSPWGGVTRDLGALTVR